MFARTFRTIRKTLAPRWLTEEEGELVGYSLDIVKDAFLERLRLGLLARFPQNGPNGETAPEDALTAIGRDRQIFRGINETATHYAGRLVTWLDEHRTRGNPFTLMRQLAAYCDSAGAHGVSFRTVDARGNWFSRSADGVESATLKTANWNWDGPVGARWSRFWVIVYPGTLWVDSGQEWNDAGDWGDALDTWGSVGITVEQAVTLRSIVSYWKPEGTRCVNIILALDPTSFDPASPEPDGLWGPPYKYVGGVAVSSRLDTARYLRGS